MLRYTMDTDQRVLDFIINRKNPPGKDRPGQLQMSIVAMAKDLNMSGSTVHRAIERLQAAGVIISKAAHDKRQPNILEYLGETGGYNVALVEEVRGKLEEFMTYLDKLEQEYVQAVRQIQGSDILNRLAGYEVVAENEFPDGKKTILLAPIPPRARQQR